MSPVVVFRCPNVLLPRTNPIQLGTSSGRGVVVYVCVYFFTKRKIILGKTWYRRIRYQLTFWFISNIITLIIQNEISLWPSWCALFLRKHIIRQVLGWKQERIIQSVVGITQDISLSPQNLWSYIICIYVRWLRVTEVRNLLKVT